MTLNHRQESRLDWIAYLQSAYTVYFHHFRESFNQRKLAILQLNAFWAWFSYLLGVALLVASILPVFFNLNHPFLSLALFTVVAIFVHPLLSSIISFAIIRIQKSNPTNANSA